MNEREKKESRADQLVKCAKKRPPQLYLQLKEGLFVFTFPDIRLTAFLS
jgi:hypothetical protein